MTGAVALSCPSCGGPLRAPGGGALSECRHCGGRALLTGDDGVMRLRAGTRIDRDGARRVLAQAVWRRPDAPRGLDAAARVTSLRLAWIPYLEVRAVRVGRNTGGALRRAHVQDTSVVVHDFNVVAPTTDDEDRGLTTLTGRVRDALRRADDLEPFDPWARTGGDAPGVVVHPTRSLDAVATSHTRGPSGRYTLLDERRRLVYWPVWLADWRWDGDRWQATICARTGDVIHARVPRRTDRALWLAVGMTALAGLGSGVLVRAVVQMIADGGVPDETWTGVALVLAPVVALVASVLLAGAWNQLRHRAETVVEGDRYRVEHPAKKGAGILELMARCLADLVLGKLSR